MHIRRHLRYSKSKAERFPPLVCVIFLFPSRLAIEVEVVQVAPSQPWQKSLNNAAVEGKAGRLHERLRTPLPTHACSAGTSVLPDNISAFTIIMGLVPGWGVHTAYSIHIKCPKALGNCLNTIWLKQKIQNQKKPVNILHYNCVLIFTRKKWGISRILTYALHWMLLWNFKWLNGKRGLHHILLKIQSQSCKIYVHTYSCFSTENSFKENLDEKEKHGWKAFAIEIKCSFLFN